MPKTLTENLSWRQELRRQAENDEEVRHNLLAASSQSFLFWVNAFVWTYRQKITLLDGSETIVTGPQSNVPFITWVIQDEIADQIVECIFSGQDLNVEKSRDMGVTWLVLAICDWLFLFRQNFNAGVVSRKEVLVDSRGDMDSLFEKLRYIHRLLPAWMMPRHRTRYMHLHNLELNSTIAGESTNTDVGRGGRKSMYFVDEAAAIINAVDIEHSLSQNTPCQVWVSTPKGPSTCFHERIKEGRGLRLQMPWYRHPEKAQGAYQFIDEADRIRWTSPWFEKQLEKYSRKTIAQEVEMDHGQAGDIFFDYYELERHRKDHQAEPMFTGDLMAIDAMLQEEQTEALQQNDCSNLHFLKYHNKSPWRFWVPLVGGRPPQDWTYIFGIDISNGTGESNSVISVYVPEINMIVAKYWYAFISPEELAVHAAMAGLWFGGVGGPAFVIWENNGPGSIFGRKFVLKLQYPHYYRNRQDGQIRKKKSSKWGWHTSNERKEVLLGNYRDALSRDYVINPCKESLDEAMDYIYRDDGLLIPAKLREEKSGGHKLHGDHVMADALCVLAAEELPRQKQAKLRAPSGSYAFRKELHKRNQARNDPWRI